MKTNLVVLVLCAASCGTDVDLSPDGPPLPPAVEPRPASIWTSPAQPIVVGGEREVHQLVTDGRSWLALSNTQRRVWMPGFDWETAHPGTGTTPFAAPFPGGFLWPATRQLERLFVEDGVPVSLEAPALSGSFSGAWADGDEVLTLGPGDESDWHVYRISTEPETGALRRTWEGDHDGASTYLDGEWIDSMVDVDAGVLTVRGGSGHFFSTSLDGPVPSFPTQPLVTVSGDGSRVVVAWVAGDPDCRTHVAWLRASDWALEDQVAVPSGCSGPVSTAFDGGLLVLHSARDGAAGGGILRIDADGRTTAGSLPRPYGTPCQPRFVAAAGREARFFCHGGYLLPDAAADLTPVAAPLSSQHYVTAGARVACTRDSCLVAYPWAGRARGVRLRKPDGAVVDAEALDLGPCMGKLTAADDHYLMVCDESLTRISGAGAIEGRVELGDVTPLGAVWNGTHYLLLADDGEGLGIQRLADDGLEPLPCCDEALGAATSRDATLLRSGRIPVLVSWLVPRPQVLVLRRDGEAIVHHIPFPGTSLRDAAATRVSVLISAWHAGDHADVAYLIDVETGEVGDLDVVPDRVLIGLDNYYLFDDGRLDAQGNPIETRGVIGRLWPPNLVELSATRLAYVSGSELQTMELRELP